MVHGEGFYGYFCSAFSRYCAETVRALESIGANFYASCLNEAINLFSKDFDFSDEVHTLDYMDKHDNYFNKFNEIESNLYEGDGTDVETLLATFAIDNNL
ncbi:MAG: DUF4375 domain-containing protein [Ruminococcus sp.]|nr:DUF4375 domain-containing protein [Ruminococcus sp.]